jgi:hypothetical protein
LNDFSSKLAQFRCSGLTVSDLSSVVERRLLADSANSTKDSEADIREGWEGLADGQNGRGRLTERPLGEACSQSNKADVSEAALPDATHRALP